MILFKKGVNFVLDHFQFSPRNHGARVLLSILFIAAAFSLLGLLTDKYSYQAQKTNIEMKFKTREERTMIEVLQRCNGDLTNPATVQQCLEDEYLTQVQEPARNYKMANVKIFGWMILWLSVVGAYAGIIYVQSKNIRLKTD